MHSEPFTCLSDKSHDNRVSDVRLHYSGCVRFSDRAYFLNTLSPDSRQSVLRQQDRTKERRDKLETTHRDSTAGERLDEFKEALTLWYISKGRKHSPYAGESRPPSSLNGLLAAADDVDADVKASIMYFRNAQPYDVPTLPNSFPNQSLSVKELLTDDPANNPLMQPCDEDTVRYFHFPANNMSWVEEAMARYYHETKPDSDDLFVKARLRRSRTRTETLLRPEYWQGQQGFEDNAEVHARHMRPFCGSLSSGPSTSIKSSPRNTVLFMPYLHWETDRGRIRTACFIKEASRHKLMSVSEVVEQAQQKDNGSEEEMVPSPRARLARVFLTAAALYEAMELQTEEQLVYKYLYAKAPLHPRRTLDQSYYGALKSTGARDRDQVVYRGTTPEPHDCPRPKHCKPCRDDSRKVSRLIMVDQLWLWILDENTVITFCPRRFGKHKPDPSAIHKSIRARLKYASRDEVSSAYDLALIIIDQCSRVFFDRTRANDRQPNMTEMFASAIRGVTYKQTAAFDQFLIYTHLASGQYKRDRSADVTTQNTLLNINPEGKLLKEVKDIMDEIHIMLRIQEQQQIVLEGFVDQIKHAVGGHERSHPSLTSDRSTIQDRPITAAGLYDEHDVPVNTGDYRQRDRPQHRARGTLARAQCLLTDLEERKLELNALLSNARNTSTALKDLLTLKQQQAGVIEAREAVKQAAETLKQGQSIMLFTVITIIFLPLSFFATVFGMNAKELNGGSLSLVHEFVYMFPISAGIIVTSFLLAFSRSLFNNSLVVLVRNAVSFVFNTAFTWVFVNTGLYLFGRSMSSAANRLKDKENKATSAMKAEVMRRKAYLEKMRAASAITDIVGARIGGGRPANEAGMTQRTTFGGLSSPLDGGATGERFSGGSVMGSRSRSPLMSPMTQQKGGLLGVTEYDVELGQWDRQSVSRDGSGTGTRPF